MAPGKNQIKAEQALQGESCPDPATLPLKPGATRRKRQRPKELGRVWWSVKKLQEATKPAKLYACSFAPFVRLVKEITESLPSQVKRWTPEALLWLQDAAEDFLDETIDVELQLIIRQMHASSSLHDVFHDGLLKKFVGALPSTPPPLPSVHHGATQPVPERASRTRLARGVRQVLIHWQGEPAASATWEDVDAFQDRYPSFQLKDELLVEGGRDVMGGATVQSPASSTRQGSSQWREAARDLNRLS